MIQLQLIRDKSPAFADIFSIGMAFAFPVLPEQQLHIFMCCCFFCLTKKVLQYSKVSKLGRPNLYFKLSIGYEEAAAYRKAKGQYLRPSQWEDLTCEVFIWISFPGLPEMATRIFSLIPDLTIQL